MQEFPLLAHIHRANASLGARVVIPPGDDMGMVRLGGRDLLAAVDQLIDGVHVRVDRTPIELVGRKAITRSLSDVAAMAARPAGALVAATLPPDFGERRAAALFDAMRDTCDQYDSPLFGGDIAFHREPSHPLTCSVTVLAEPEGRVITRRGARPGDQVYVTGPLGGSLEADGLGRHLTFEPRIALALRLASELGEGLHAMIDTSDGLGRDVSHIATLSNVQVRLHSERIPCQPGCDWRRALRDGEDYELCFTCAGPVEHPIMGMEMLHVGEVAAKPTDDPRPVIIRVDGRWIDAGDMGWQHGA